MQKIQEQWWVASRERRLWMFDERFEHQDLVKITSRLSAGIGGSDCAKANHELN